MSAQDLPVVHRDSRCLGMGLAMSLSPWVAPDFGLKLLGDVWSLVAGLLAFILMVVHFVLVAEHKPIEGMVFISAPFAIRFDYATYIHYKRFG